MFGLCSNILELNLFMVLGDLLASLSTISTKGSMDPEGFTGRQMEWPYIHWTKSKISAASCLV